MTRVYITGDTHADFKRFTTKNFKKIKYDGYEGCTPDNTYIFICGDFGGVFDTKPGENETRKERYWLNWLGEKPVTFIVVGGNHENWDAIEANYPVVEWHGGRVRMLRPNVIWVERGEIVEVAGKRFWCFGGAQSTDKAYRTPGKSWWAREQASQKEFDYGYSTFEKNWDNINYIVSHAAPSQIANFMPGCRGTSETEMFLNRIWWLNQRQVRHFCGHMHHNFRYDMYGYDVTILFDQIMLLVETEDESTNGIA